MTNGQRRREALLTKPLAAIVYLRVSTDKQQTSGVGIEAQLAKCTEHCARLGIPITSIRKDEGISGKDGLDKRPGLRAVLEDVDCTPGAVVVVYSLSRLGRSQRLIWNLLDDRGEYALPLSSATEPFETTTPMGRAMLGMLGVWAQLESDLVSERTVDALKAVAARGTKLGAPSMVRKGVDVKLVRELYATGQYTYRSLVEELNARGVKTARGGKWWLTSVHHRSGSGRVVDVQVYVVALPPHPRDGGAVPLSDAGQEVRGGGEERG